MHRWAKFFSEEHFSPGRILKAKRMLCWTSFLAPPVSANYLTYSAMDIDDTLSLNCVLSSNFTSFSIQDLTALLSVLSVPPGCSPLQIPNRVTSYLYTRIHKRLAACIQAGARGRFFGSVTCASIYNNEMH